jgi:hypothetical protein
MRCPHLCGRTPNHNGRFRTCDHRGKGVNSPSAVPQDELEDCKIQCDPGGVERAHAADREVQAVHLTGWVQLETFKIVMQCDVVEPVQKRVHTRHAASWARVQKRAYLEAHQSFKLTYCKRSALSNGLTCFMDPEIKTGPW